ncbi:MAG TPA: serine hydrolase domain-containing protein, partial [Rubrivivax sp.]|nr:serine hydrolase domain-containing protein [Rubrivivax sp.]
FEDVRRLLAQHAAGYTDRIEPGLAFTLLHRGVPVLSEFHGFANIEHRVRLGPKTRLQLASMSKQFTAAALVMLAHQDRMSLDAPIGTWLGDLPPSLGDFTARDLLAMRTGLLEAGQLSWLVTGSPHHAWRSHHHVVETVKGCAHRNHTPGGRDLYSNSNYILAQMLGEAVTRAPWRDALQALIFAPLGMQHSCLIDNARLALPDLATAYRPVAGGFERCMWPVEDGAPAGVVSTIDDMQRWLAALRHNTVLQPAELPELLADDRPLASGRSSCYRLGLRQGELFGRRVRGHAGSVPGFKTEYLWFPDEDVVLLLLANREDVRENLLLGRLAGALFGEPAWPEEPPAALAPRGGIFVDAVRGRVLEVGDDAGLLHSDLVHFIRQGQTSYQATNPFQPRQLVFTQDNNVVVSMDLDGAIEYQRGQVTPLTGQAATRYTGVFGAPGVPAEIELRIDADGGLRFATGPRGALRQQWHAGQLAPDLLVLGDAPGQHSMTSIRLQRGPDDELTSIVLNGYRLYDLVLHRLDT